MTRKEKIRILKAMLPLIDGVEKVGICLAYQLVTGTSCYCLEHERHLEELGINPAPLTERPSYDGRSYWYPLDKKGDNLRRAAIRRAIKRLQTK